MATHKSAEKRARGNERKRNVNKQNVSAFKTAVKKFKDAVNDIVENMASQEANPESLKKLFVEAQSRVARAVAKGVLHKNAAARKVSRMAVHLKKASEALAKSGSSATGDAPKKTKRRTATRKK